MKRLYLLLLLLMGTTVFSQTAEQSTLKDFVDGLRVDSLKDAEIKVIMDGKEVNDLKAVPFESFMYMAMKITQNENTKDDPPRPSLTITIEPLDENPLSEPVPAGGKE